MLAPIHLRTDGNRKKSSQQARKKKFKRTDGGFPQHSLVPVFFQTSTSNLICRSAVPLPAGGGAQKHNRKFSSKREK
jgi:hypothetical protein